MDPIAWLHASSTSASLRLYDLDSYLPAEEPVLTGNGDTSQSSYKDEVRSYPCKNFENRNMRHKLKEFSLVIFLCRSNARGQTNQYRQTLGCWLIVFLSPRIIV